MIRASTRLAAVLGWPVSHSRSPELHNAAYAAAGVDAVYLALAVPPEQLADAIRAVRQFGMLGVNVTVPHKSAVVPLCDDIDDLARGLGAVNTIVRRDDGRIIGHNTDADGFRDALAERGLPSQGPAVVLGAGGGARAVVYALAQVGLAPSVIARDPDKGAPLLGIGAAEVLPWTADAFATVFPRASIVVDSTSAALDPIETAFRVAPPLDRLPAGALVASLVYHRDVPLLAAARARGLPTMDGGGMLLHQAARAFTLMTGKPAPVEAMRAALQGAGTSSTQTGR